MIVVNLATPPLANRIRPAHLIACGLVVAGVGYAIFTVASSTSGPQAIFVAMCGDGRHCTAGRPVQPLGRDALHPVVHRVIDPGLLSARARM